MSRIIEALTTTAKRVTVNAKSVPYEQKPLKRFNASVSG